METPICFPDGKPEEWRLIPQSQGHYYASTWSRIKRIAYQMTGRDGRTCNYKEKIILGSITKYGRNTVIINNKTRNRSVWLMMAFKGFVPRGHKQIIDHIDNDPAN